MNTVLLGSNPGLQLKLEQPGAECEFHKLDNLSKEPRLASIWKFH